MDDNNDSNVMSKLVKLIHSDLVFTDLMIEEDAPVMAKGPSGWVPVDSIPFPYIGREDIGSILNNLDPDWENTISERALNRPLDLSEWRLRVNAYLAYGGNKLMMSIRKMPTRPLGFNEIGLPASVRLMLDSPRGLILIAGATGSGKSTSMAAMADVINETRSAHIVTIEDPIEYMFERKKAIFSQREVGVDVGSFFEGVRDAMRQRPDVIVIGEIRDKDTAETALLAAESGHLVIGTIHANTAPGAVQKLLAFFNSQEREAKVQSLASTLIGVIAQILLPAEDKSGFVLASELLFNHKQQFSKVLGDPDKLASMLERKEDSVSRSMVDALFELVSQKKVSKAEAIRSVAVGQTSLYEKLKTIV